MQFKFDDKLDFQLEAINSAIGLFREQKYHGEGFGLVSKEQIVSNQLQLSDDQILSNLQEIQQQNGLEPSKNLDGMNFSIEMETGTGKTFIYLKTIFELNKNYGFKKFIIIVPTVAIREGVKKSLEITKSHFENIYENLPYVFYEYDSRKISSIKQFARSNKIEILIMTLDSFNKDTNIMNTKHDKIGAKPIELLSKSNPILILDEPQNMESAISKKAIARMNPLFTLRYSATHKNIYNMIYQLTPVTAYNRRLVKKIEVLSVVKSNDFNNVFIQCNDIIPGSVLKAKLTVNKKLKKSYTTKTVVVKSGDDLYKKTEMPEYKGFKIIKIDARKNSIKFSNGHFIKLGDEQGGNRDELIQIQIEKAIEEHFWKYNFLKKHGIKVITLFFIDRVDNYKQKDGIIRKFFVEAFNRLKINEDDFKDLDVNTVHRGYFSKKKTEKAMQDDKDTFNLIMKDKERLLSFEEPVQFIFSHSALREGWDNPNVFNICTLNQSVSTIRKRQEIGRGIRLPVNQEGERIQNEHFNILTVIANESYASYASNLQKEYVDQYGDPSKAAPVENADNRQILKLKKNFKKNTYFNKLWEKICTKTDYTVNIDTDLFIKNCIKRISDEISITAIEIQTRRAELSLTDEAHVRTKITEASQKELDLKFSIPNIVDKLEKDTKLTRKSLVEILSKIPNLDLIFLNPQDFILKLTEIIKDEYEKVMVDNIRYIPIGEKYSTDLFDDLPSHKERIQIVDNSIYDGIEYDSKTEKDFAAGLSNDSMKIVKLLLKLPSWFLIKTPVGNHNPDWAVVTQNPGSNPNYLVTETKGKKVIHELRPEEGRKIRCAKAHFKALGITYDVSVKPEDILSIIK